MFAKVASIRSKGYVPDTILDIGAYKGTWTDQMLPLYPSAEYFLFEAIDYSELDKFSKQRNIHVYKDTILNESAKEVTWYEKRNTGDSMFLENTSFFTNAVVKTRPSISLNDLTEKSDGLRDAKHIFMKIDCQGAEIPILKGATSLLERTDFILLEIPFFGQYNKGVPSFLDHIAYMDSIGFIPYDIAGEHNICTYMVQVDIIFINKRHEFNRRVQEALISIPVYQKPKKVTILTYCSGYRYEVFRRFAGTLYDTGFSGDLIFVIQKQDVAHVEQLRSVYKNVSYYIDDVDNDRHCQQKRYYIFQKILKTLTTDYVLVCDSRDVFFQKNIELYPVDPTIDCFFFEEGLTIGACPHNQRWLRLIEEELGIEFQKDIKDKKISCSGTTYGTLAGIQVYVDQICDLMTHKIHGHNDGGFDQGIHNYLIYVEGVKCRVKLLANEDNLVNTLQYAQYKFINGRNQIINVHQEPSYVVHQWDRLPKYMTERLCSKYDFSIGH